MSTRRKGILSAEETERLTEVVGTLRRIQAITDHCLEAVEELTGQCAEIGRAHGVPAYSAADGDACNAG